MITTIVVLAYVANVFLNRWLNKLWVKENPNNPIIPLAWFFSIPATIAFFVMINSLKNSNWFTGKYWK